MATASPPTIPLAEPVRETPPAPADAAGPAPRRRRALRAAALALLFVVPLLGIPDDLVPREAGIDPSYRHALARIAAQGASAHGNEIVFPYGPLGDLLVPVDVGHRPAWATLVSLLLIAGTIVPLVLVFRAGRPGAALAALALLHGAHVLGLPKESRVVAVILLALAALRAGARPRGPLLVLAGLPCGFALLAKFSIGVIGLGALLVALGAALVRRDPGAGREGGIALASFAVLPAIALVAVFGSLDAMATWLRGSLELAAGYGEAMSLPGSPAVRAAGIAALVVVAVGLAIAARRECRLETLVPSLLVVLVLSFQHGFVRQDNHVVIFFSTAAVVLAAAALAASWRRQHVALAVSTALFVALLPFGYAKVVERSPGWGTAALRRATGVQGVRRLARLARWSATRAEIAAQGERNLAASALPERWVERIRTEGGTVDAFPWDLAPLFAAGLAWTPQPTLQSYTAYTPWLDARLAAHWAGDRAPRYIVGDLAGIDGRHPFFAAPRAAREMLSRYELAAVERGGRRLLLERVAAPRLGTPRPVAAITAAPERWIDVPPADGGPVFARISWSKGPTGAVRALATGTPPAIVELERDDGSRAAYRFIPRTAPGGLLVNPLPRHPGEWARLVALGDGPATVRLRITGPARSVFAERIDVVFERAPWLRSAAGAR